MTLLTICQNAASEIGIDAPSFIINNTETTAKQLLALCRRSLREIGKIGWPNLITEYKFDTSFIPSQAAVVISGGYVITGITSTAGMAVDNVVSCTHVPYGSRIVTVDSPTQITIDRQATASGAALIVVCKDSYPLPSDYLGMVDQTEWDRTNRWQLLGPLEAQEWQVLRSGIAPVGPRFRFRLWGGKIYIDPPPQRISTIAFEYVAKSWVVSAIGVYQSDWLLDTDTSLIDEDLLELELIWRFKQQKGLEYAEDFNQAKQAISRDRGRIMSGRVLNLSSRPTTSSLLGGRNIPDTGFGQ
jgi:hypothetical protein